VLHVARLTDPTGRYYLNDQQVELSPGGGSANHDRSPTRLAPGGTGRWTGAAAARLGLTGPVAATDLAGVLAGGMPGSGRPLVRRRGAVAGYDLTFTAPKSASVLFALGGAEAATETVAAHEEAVEAAMGYVARRAAAVRRGGGDERRLVPVSGLVAAAFSHSVSRALDPHLHTHVVVANLGHGPDGRWTALDGRGLFAHALAAGHLYDAELRHRLTQRLGLGWQLRSSGRHEVEGIGPDVVGAFSSRRAEILGHLATQRSGMVGRTGRPSHRSFRVARVVTRDAKEPGVEPAALARRWREQAEACGVDAGTLSARLGRTTTSESVVDEHRFSNLLSQASPGGVARRDAVTAWAGALERGASVADVERCCDLVFPWPNAVGVAEGRRPPAAVSPGHLLLAGLGPRPGSPRLLGVWLDAADAVTRYRTRWGVTDRSRPLGGDSGGELAGFAAHRLADHLATARVLGDARRVLGRGRWAEPPERSLGLG
jgi:conjugative relaxase-like TrwC/TraI family protein